MPLRTKRAKQAAKARQAAVEAKRKITEKATKGNSIVAERRQSTEESQAALQGSFLSLGSFSSVSITCLCDKCSDGNARRGGLTTKGLPLSIAILGIVVIVKVKEPVAILIVSVSELCGQQNHRAVILLSTPKI